MIGRLIHLTFDALAISTILSGIKRTTGFVPQTEQIPESSIRSFADGYLNTGDTIFNLLAGQVVTSQYFKRADPTSKE